jgi:hypothetical protein
MIELTERAERHLALHFGDSNAAGSVFFKDVFEGPNDLLNYINSCEPVEILEQANNRSSLLFHTVEAVGYSGIIERNCVTIENIILETRNGFQVEVALLEELELAYEFCVIVETNNDIQSIVTAGQDEEEFEKSTLFWQEYILCRKKIIKE